MTTKTIAILLATIGTAAAQEGASSSNALPLTVLDGVQSEPPFVRPALVRVAGTNGTTLGEVVPAATNSVRLVSGGAEADYGRHKVSFSANIGDNKPVKIVMPDGRRLHCRPAMLAYFDTATGTSALLAEVVGNQGEVRGAKKVVYAYAFSDVQADVQYSYSPAALEQDIVLHQGLPQPEAFGLNSDTTRLEVWTEFFVGRRPRMEGGKIRLGRRFNQSVVVAAEDMSLDFGAMKIVAGKAFGSSDETNAVPVAKEWHEIGTRNFLVESVDYPTIAPALQSLPAVASIGGKLRTAHDRAELVQLMSPAQLFPNHPDAMRIAGVGADADKSFVLDFVIVASVPLPAGAVSWWPARSNALDIVSANHGTMTNGATFAAGEVGQCFSLDGTNDFVEVPNAAALNPTNAITVECWVNRQSAVGTWDPVVKKSGVAGNGQIAGCSLEFSGNNIVFWVYTGNSSWQPSGSVALNNNQWYHVAGVYNGTNVLCYVNGTASAPGTASGGIVASTNPLRIGNDPGNPARVFKGSIDEVTVYNRALTASEIQDIYWAGGAGKQEPNCVMPSTNAVGWWPGDGNVYDLARTNFGTLQGDAGYAGGEAAQAFNFDGNGDYVNVANNPALNPTNSITVECWLYRRASVGSYDTVVKKTDLTQDSGYSLEFENDFINFFAYNGAWRRAYGPVMNSNQWYHVAGVYDGTNIVCYVNGTAYVPVAATGNLVPSTNSLRIANDPANTNRFFNGLIDEVTLYNRALTATEISSIYTAGVAGKCKVDTDHDGLTDLQEGFLGTDPNKADTDGDGVTDGDEAFVYHTNPNDYYNGILPVLSAYSGNNQNGEFNAFVPQPLVVQAATAGGVPLANAPITFNLSQGLVQIATATNATLGSQIALRTDSNGRASIVAFLPDNTSEVNTVTVSATTGGSMAQTTFTCIAFVPTPNISPATGSYLLTQNAAITSRSPSAVIHFTVDGTDPTTADTVINSGSSYPVCRSLTLKAKAFKDNLSSAVQAAAFSITCNGSVSAGNHHNLALRSDGTVFAWGLNANGELGIGNLIDQSNLVAIAGLSNVIRVAAGDLHSLALKTDGKVCAWGNNGSGRLGDGTTTQRTSPVQVTNLTGITSIAAGGVHSLALDLNSNVWAWGENGSGEIGNGTNTDQKIPVLVVGLTNVMVIDAGQQFSLALKADRTVWAWGENGNSQIGDGTNIDRFLPQPVAGLSNIIAIAAGGMHCLALESNGVVWGWGYNSSGQLGDGTTTTQKRPVKVVTNLNSVASIAAGYTHSLALLADGTLQAWGNNASGQVGDGTVINRKTNVAVLSISGVISVSGGEEHSIAMLNDGTLRVWGHHEFGQTGTGEFDYRATAGQVVGVSNILGIASGAGHILAFQTNGNLLAWGRNDNGGLGNSNTVDQGFFVNVVGISNVVAVEGGDLHSVAAKADGTVWSWGNNGSGRLGDNTTTQRITPIKTTNITSVARVVAGAAYSLAISNGYVWAWGDNSSGQLGDGTKTDRKIPSKVVGPSNVVSVAAGATHCLALMSNGKIWAWGEDGHGQVGDGSLVDRTNPVVLASISNVMAVAAGGNHSLALLTNGTVLAWGYNNVGQLGDGTTTQRTNAVVVTNLSSVMTIAAGDVHSLAVLSNGTVRTWGGNSRGQLGDGGTTNQKTNVGVLGLTNITSVAGGDLHSVALKKDGTVWVWGDTIYGQLGNGNVGYNAIPVVPLGDTHLVDWDDADQDGLLTWREKQLGTNPNAADTDGDGLKDGWEVDNGYDPTNAHTGGTTANDGEKDKDGDSLSNISEIRKYNSDPSNPKSLNPNVKDGAFFTSAALGGYGYSFSVSQPNFVGNRIEFAVNGAQPETTFDVYVATGLVQDNTVWKPYYCGSPGQQTFSIPNPGYPIAFFRVAFASDEDGDGLTDGYECLVSKTVIDSRRSDGDNIPDGFEVQYGLNPLAPLNSNTGDDSDVGDPDGDGKKNSDEYNGGLSSTDPKRNNNTPATTPQRSVVTIVATDPSASEADGSTATFRITRTGSYLSPVDVYYILGGTATLTSDYTLSPAPAGSYPTFSIHFNQGETYKDITVTPVADSINEGPETVIVGLAPSPTEQTSTDKYVVVDRPNRAVATIRDRICYTFDLNADWQSGIMSGLSVSGGSLQLNAATMAQFPYINVACQDGNSGRPTVVRVKTTDTGDFIGEYRTAPETISPNPSRTTVDQFGNVWVANRDDVVSTTEFGSSGSITKIALVIGGTRCDANGAANVNGQFLKPPFDYSTAVDRDGDGLIKTSKGLGDILPWSNTRNTATEVDTLGGVSTAEDELITEYARVPSGGTRTIAVDKFNDLWVGGRSDRRHAKVYGLTGTVVPDSTFSPQAGGYGGVIDKNGVIWSSTGVESANLLRFVPPSSLPVTPSDYQLLTSSGNYGIAVDPTTGKVWHTAYSGGVISRWSPDGTTQSVFNNHGGDVAQGVVVDANNTVWVAHGNNDDVGRLSTDGTFQANITLALNGATGSSPTGAAVDSEGMIWATCRYSHNMFRIDPTKGTWGEVVKVVDFGTGIGLAPPYNTPPFLYNYSDMTGFNNNNIVNTTGCQLKGYWRAIKDSGSPNTAWQNVSWVATTPSGSAVQTFVRASNDRAALANATFVEATSGTALSAVTGRFLEVRVSLKRASCSDNPHLDSLTVCGESSTFLSVMPLSNITVTEGADADLHVVASGTEPLHYEWSHNGVPVSGVDDTVLHLTSPDCLTAGNYSVRVTDAVGSVVDVGPAYVNVLPRLIAIPAAGSTAFPARAGVYPAQINVAGAAYAISSVTVSLFGFTHPRPDDVDILLVSPAGQKIMLMSDAGGANAAQSLTLTFSKFGNTLPDNDQLYSTVYAPANYGESETSLPAAVGNNTSPPTGPYLNSLTDLAGTDPNGVWRLYVVDDSAGESGFISGSWCVTITPNLSLPLP